MLKITTVVGARPQFVKAAVLSRQFRGMENISEKIIHTGQHFDDQMSKIFFDELEIPVPTLNLGIHSLNHCAMIGRLTESIGEVLTGGRPDLVLVYGDTNSTLAAAIAAKKNEIPLAHVEAGIRTGDESAPEESNRYLVDRMANFNFCCTQVGVDNLIREGFQSGLIDTAVHNFGDVMKDAALFFSKRKPSQNSRSAERRRSFIVATIHRPENTDHRDKLAAIVMALNDINKETDVVFPVHPRTTEALRRYGLKFDFPVSPPVGYLEMLGLLSGCSGVITDSGGLVREAYFFGRPSVLVLGKPAWVELIKNGSCERVDCSIDQIIPAIARMRDKHVTSDDCPFGSGNAGELIARYLVTNVR